MQEMVEHRLHFEIARNERDRKWAVTKSQTMQGIQTNYSSNRILQQVLLNSGWDWNQECEAELFVSRGKASSCLS